MDTTNWSALENALVLLESGQDDLTLEQRCEQAVAILKELQATALAMNSEPIPGGETKANTITASLVFHPDNGKQLRPELQKFAKMLAGRIPTPSLWTAFNEQLSNFLTEVREAQKHKRDLQEQVVDAKADREVLLAFRELLDLSSPYE